MKARQLLIPIVLAAGVTLALAGLLRESGREAAAAPLAPWRYVATTGSDAGNDCTNQGSPCRTVQHAVDVADSGDTIKVASGTYSDVHARPQDDITSTGVVTQVVYLRKSVTLRGGYTTENWSTSEPSISPTTLDAKGRGRVLYITGDISATVEGLHITGGDATGLGGATWGLDGGGAVYVEGAALTIGNCVIYSNTASTGEWGHGGGLASLRSRTTLEGNMIVGNNAAGHGGGFFSVETAALLTENTIERNTAQYHGGALFAVGSDLTLAGNLIRRNISKLYGGGLALIKGEATLVGNVVDRNIAGRYGGGLSLHCAGSAPMDKAVNESDADDAGGLFVASDLESTVSADSPAIAHKIAICGAGRSLGAPSDVRLVNNVIADNEAGASGSGLYVDHCPLRVSHTTIARNGGGDGSGIHLAGDGTSPGVSLVNTILVSHAVGIRTDGGNKAILTATLWGHGPWSNVNDWHGAGTVLTGTINVRGDPAFRDPGVGDYHIAPTSAAIDQGVEGEVETDLDGEPRPAGLGCDLGADEFSAALSLSKQVHADRVQAGEALTYTLRVSNTGSVDLHATIVDALPVHVTPSGTRTWEKAIPAPGGVWTDTVVVDAEVGYVGPLVNTVRVTTDEGARGTHTIVSQVEAARDAVYLPLVMRAR